VLQPIGGCAIAVGPIAARVERIPESMHMRMMGCGGVVATETAGQRIAPSLQTNQPIHLGPGHHSSLGCEPRPGDGPTTARGGCLYPRFSTTWLTHNPPFDGYKAEGLPPITIARPNNRSTDGDQKGRPAVHNHSA